MTAENRPGDRPTRSTPGDVAPGSDAPAGTPGTGEDICPVCKGSGRTTSGSTTSGRCPTCDGSGRIIEGIGGG